MEQPTEPDLTLSPDQLQRVQEHLLHPLAIDTWQHFEAAILMGADQYLYVRRTQRCPLSLSYKCLSPEALERAFHLAQIDTGWLAPGVVRSGMAAAGDWAVLVIPRQCHALVIAGEAGELRLKVPLPPLVLVGLGQTYWLWAIPDKTFSPQSRMMLAPLPNTNPYAQVPGEICWGSNQPPLASAQSLPQAWDLFVTSPFTRHSVRGKSRQYPDDIIQHLHRLQGRRSYPSEDLIPAPGLPPLSIEQGLKVLLNPEYSR
ncbi:hypothetical protein [Leptolyngbya sp. PCC 6406]|uniref:hypothetical protein n=1 Tax=Leptolyngbya sp. PCC 6406 TaxID=1173264 RepID=UPI0002AC8D2D|nr:hypothetical protein [Leptolyngbya sp. PCC 6406]